MEDSSSYITAAHEAMTQFNSQSLEARERSIMTGCKQYVILIKAPGIIRYIITERPSTEDNIIFTAYEGKRI